MQRERVSFIERGQVRSRMVSAAIGRTVHPMPVIEAEVVRSTHSTGMDGGTMAVVSSLNQVITPSYAAAADTVFTQ
jgi:hypothetical protein